MKKQKKEMTITIKKKNWAMLLYTSKINVVTLILFLKKVLCIYLRLFFLGAGFIKISAFFRSKGVFILKKVLSSGSNC